jgi:hypothetical protein
MASVDRLEIDLIIDVGANEGQFSEEIRVGGYSGRIISFEPTTEAHSRLLKRSQRDPLWNVSGTPSTPSPTSAVQKVVLLILNELRCFSVVFLHYILHRF